MGEAVLPRQHSEKVVIPNGLSAAIMPQKRMQNSMRLHPREENCCVPSTEMDAGRLTRVRISPFTRTSTTEIRNGRYADGLIQTLCDYRGFTFHLRGEADGRFGLSTDKSLPIEGLEMIERGVYGICVPCSEVSNIREITL